MEHDAPPRWRLLPHKRWRGRSVTWGACVCVFLHFYLLVHLDLWDSSKVKLPRMLRGRSHSSLYAQGHMRACPRSEARSVYRRWNPTLLNTVFWLTFPCARPTRSWHSLAASLLMFTSTSEENICSGPPSKQRPYCISRPVVAVFSLPWPEPWESKRRDRVTSGMCGISTVCHTERADLWHLWVAFFCWDASVSVGPARNSTNRLSRLWFLELMNVESDPCPDSQMHTLWGTHRCIMGFIYKRLSPQNPFMVLCKCKNPNKWMYLWCTHT